MIDKILAALFGLIFTVYSAEIGWNSDSRQQQSPSDDHSGIGAFWQVTDIHYDSNYSQQGSLQAMCHQMAADNDSPGMFGEFLCDSPWTLAVSAVKAMKDIHPNPDFILWTGDNTPHVAVDTTDSVYASIHNVTTLLRDTFPDLPIIPSVGNHDSWPANLIPTGPDAYFDTVLSYCGWDQMVPPSELQTFRKGGYYSNLVRPGVRVISLNTILWYYLNNLTRGLDDPGDQFSWLEKQLAQAKAKSEKVLLSGHVAVGMLDKSWFYPQLSKRLLTLIQEYSDVIAALIYGHEHTDQFRVVNDKNGHPSVPVFLSPAVTPQTAKLEWATNNPSIRLYKYNRSTGKIVEILQYYLNLTAANANNQADWLMEYEFTKTYGIPDLSATSLQHLADKFIPVNSELFHKYFVHFEVSTKPFPCNSECKKKHICAITQVDYDSNAKCQNSVKVMSVTEAPPRDTPTTRHYPAPPPPPHPSRPHHQHKPVPRYMYFVIYSLVILVLVLFAAITAYCCCREPRRVAYTSQPRYVLIS